MSRRQCALVQGTPLRVQPLIRRRRNRGSAGSARVDRRDRVQRRHRAFHFRLVVLPVFSWLSLVESRCFRCLAETCNDLPDILLRSTCWPQPRKGTSALEETWPVCGKRDWCTEKLVWSPTARLSRRTRRMRRSEKSLASNGRAARTRARPGLEAQLPAGSFAQSALGRKRRRPAPGGWTLQTGDLLVD